jgi:hypothetical protein
VLVLNFELVLWYFWSIVNSLGGSFELVLFFFGGEEGGREGGL